MKNLRSIFRLAIVAILALVLSGCYIDYVLVDADSYNEEPAPPPDYPPPPPPPPSYPPPPPPPPDPPHPPRPPRPQPTPVPTPPPQNPTSGGRTPRVNGDNSQSSTQRREIGHTRGTTSTPTPSSPDRTTGSTRRSR